MGAVEVDVLLTRIVKQLPNEIDEEPGISW
jgi:hypothetical protein